MNLYKHWKLYFYKVMIVKIIEIKPVPMAVAKELMMKKEKEEEISYEQKLSIEHLKKFTKLSKDKALKLAEEISNVVKLSDEVLVQIVDILPQSIDELRLILASEKFSLREEEMNKILEVIRKYV